MKNIPLCISITLAMTASVFADDNFVDTKGKHLDIMRDGKPIVRYMYEFDRSTPEKALETYKVYYHVMDPEGTDTLTKGTGYKYTHHRGMFIGWNKVSHNNIQSDLWHLNSGEAIKHNKILQQEADKNKSILSTQIDWIKNGGKVKCLEEIRTVTVHHTDTDAHVLLDFETELKAIDGDVALKGDSEHAGFQYRAHQDVNNATFTFHEEGVDPKVDKDLPWVAESYDLRGKKYTIQYMSHPDNPKGAVYSAYRNYGRFGCFIPTVINDSETLKLKYRIRITTGETPSVEDLAAQYAKFVSL